MQRKTIWTPASDCDGKFITCSNGTQHYVIICDDDERDWKELLCGAEE